MVQQLKSLRFNGLTIQWASNSKVCDSMDFQFNRLTTQWTSHSIALQSCCFKVRLVYSSISTDLNPSDEKRTVVFCDVF